MEPKYVFCHSEGRVNQIRTGGFEIEPPGMRIIFEEEIDSTNKEKVGKLVYKIIRKKLRGYCVTSDNVSVKILNLSECKDMLYGMSRED